MLENENNLETGVALPTQAQYNTVIGNNSAKLAEIMIAQIERVQEDPKNIPQAEAVINQVKSMIDLGKAEIEMLKVQAYLSHQ